MLHVKTWIAFITHHPPMVYGAVFLSSMIESLAMVGLAFPGTMIVFGLGALVAAGHLKLQWILLLAAVGAIFGDGVSFWVGYHYQVKLKQIWPFSRYPELMVRGEAFFHRHGGKSVLFGRFVGPVRAVVPVVAGMLGMSPWRFSIVNVVSAAGWALVYILPGYFFGSSLGLAGAVSARLAVLVLVLIAAVWLFVRLARRLIYFMEYRWPEWLSTCRVWAAANPSAHGARKPLKRFVHLLLFHYRGEEFFFLSLILMLIAGGWGFLGVLQDVLAKDPLVAADQAVYHFFQSLRTPWTDPIMVAVTELGDSFVSLFIVSAVLMILLVKRCLRAAWFWLFAVLGGMLSTELLKISIRLPRPVTLYHGVSAFGFPSGHTSMTVVLYGFLAILISRNHSRRVGWGLFAAVFLVSFVIAVSRLYLGAHWLSDVLGGFLIGTAWTSILGIAYLKGKTERVPHRLLGTVMVTVIIVAGGWHISRSLKQDLLFYAPRYSLESVSLSNWLAAGWRKLPAWRIDLAGEMEQPLNVQWAGDWKPITDLLLSRGWQHPPPWNLKNLLGMLSPSTPAADLTVLPRLHDGRTDRVRLVRPMKNGRWVLRLWPSGRIVSENAMPILVGIIETQEVHHWAGWITTVKDTHEYDRALDAIEPMLRDQFATKFVRGEDRKVSGHRKDLQMNWNGKILLVWRTDRLKSGDP